MSLNVIYQYKSITDYGYFLIINQDFPIPTYFWFMLTNDITIEYEVFFFYTAIYYFSET